MVNTIVTFGNNQVSSSTPFPIIVKTDNKSILQRRLYLIIGISTLIIILIPTILSIEKDQDDFTFHTLFIVHASFLLIFFVSIAIYRNIGDGLTIIPTLVLLAIYRTVHYLIRYRYCCINSRKDFLVSTIQLTTILIFVVTYILWTYLLIRNKHRKKIIKQPKSFETAQKRIFFSLLSLNLMLTISSLILHIRHPHSFGLYEILLLSIGVPFALLWCTAGVLMSVFQNCLSITSFYFLSLIQPFHLIYLIFQAVNELNGLSSENEINKSFPMIIISFVCVSTNFFVHLFTTIAGCWMISKTEKPITNIGWLLANT
ncbi:unnamed protein product [Rotaria socialis]|uniref:DUF7789 domain-containing protein n=1 Tax=Rotaria socialis TaxID=392032 RepID=A0A818XE00_9BILA|nr:unnamed protein product [Rotaria socialis]CAF3739079.1 unnamed protein product [Rotaria socialis]CAF4523388.1 unnamed protein product [Rotaria socialis]CAF4537023.1 unnamed protein product [Rotaria socialis]